MNYGNGQNGMPIDPVGIGRILAQRVQARSGGPGQALGINQRSGGGMSMPAAPLPQEPPAQGGSDLGPTMGLLGLLGAMGNSGGKEFQGMSSTQTVPQFNAAARANLSDPQTMGLAGLAGGYGNLMQILAPFGGM